MVLFPFRVGIARFILVCAVFLAALGPCHAISVASIPSPRLKPAAPSSSQLLSKADAKTFRAAMRSASRRNWRDVKRHEAALSDPTAKAVLLWRRAADDASVSFKDLSEVKQSQPDWPRMTRIQAKAEKLMFQKPLSAGETIAWFTGVEPVSGEGRAALARAHYELGNKQSGDEWLRLAWRESKLTRDRQRLLFKRYKGRLSKEDHAARADHLIWLGRSHYSSAEALLPYMSKSDRAMMNARIRVGGNRSGMQTALNALTPAQSRETAILFERALWRRKRKSKDYALSTYLDIKTPASTEPGRKRLWREKKLISYWLLEDKRYQKAYDMALNHGMERGAEFAEAEFLAGWIALVYLNEPDRAQTHFTRLRNGVGLPVSLARASYWQGRAAHRSGDIMASNYYADAARHINTFYGQLAAQQADAGFATISLPPESDGAGLKADFEGRQIIRALRLVGEVGDERVFRQISYHLDDALKAPQELTLLAALARDYQFMSLSVRAAKQSGRFGVVLTESSYPMPSVITELGDEFNIPFVLSIARQESEFNISAISGARAYGMMQMINATAKLTARKHRIKYHKSWLTADQNYAAKLGAHHLNDLLKKYDGSYIMAAVAYNAGPNRVTRWNKRYGDPRKGEIDAIDWLENIPFSETRNYVQRVMENMQVYNARLNNGQAPLELESDINAGAFR